MTSSSSVLLAQLVARPLAHIYPIGWVYASLSTDTEASARSTFHLYQGVESCAPNEFARIWGHVKT